MEKGKLYYIDLLDKMLHIMKEASLTNDYSEVESQYKEVPDKYRLRLIRHLQKEGYTFHEMVDKADGGQIERMFISVQGLLFLEKGGFKNQYKEEMAKYNWTIAKTIANVANAIIIILIAALAVILSNKSNQQETQIKVYEDSIHKLNSKIK